MSWHERRQGITFSLFVLALACTMGLAPTSWSAEDSNAVSQSALQVGPEFVAESNDVPATSQKPQWPGFAYDPARTGQSPYKGPQTNKLKWQFTLPSWGGSVAVGADGTAYVGTDAGVLFALNTDGTEKWRFEMPTIQITPPSDWPESEKKELREKGLRVSITDVAIGPNGTVYFGQALHLWRGSTTGGFSVPGYKRKVYALDPNRAVKWTFDVDQRDIATHISIDPNGTIYFGTVKGQYDQAECHFYAVSPTGRKKWSVLLSSWGTLLSAAIGKDGTIYVGGDKLRALAPSDGSVKWEYDIQTTTSIAASPAVGPDGTIYVGTRPGVKQDNSELFAIHPDGTKKWELAVGIMETSPAIANDGTIYITSWVPDHARAEPGIKTGLTAITPDGHVKWSYETRFPDWHFNPDQRGMSWGSDSSPIVGSDGIVYFGSDVGLVYALNADGTLKWTFGAGGEFDNCPSMDAEGTLYICHAGGPGEIYDGPLRCYALNDSGTAIATRPVSVSKYVRIARLEVALEKAIRDGNEPEVKEIQTLLDRLRTVEKTPASPNEESPAALRDKINTLEKNLEQAKTDGDEVRAKQIRQQIAQLKDKLKRPMTAVRAVAIASADPRVKDALKDVTEMHVRAEYAEQWHIWRVNFYGGGRCIVSASVGDDGSIVEVEYPDSTEITQ